jgi:predicted DNA-binding transcriptional regulator YafY
MLRLIQEEPRTWTRARLAEHFEISERMCDKDLALLRQAGYDPRRFAGGYALGDRPDQARSVVVEQVD